MRASFVLSCLAACAPAVTLPPLEEGNEPALAAGRDTERHYAIWLGGAQVGVADEAEQWTATGVTLRRDETMRFLRGDALVALATTIEITADRQLAAQRVVWTETAQGTRRSEAVRDARGWRITDDRGARRLPGDATPAELAPLVVRRDGRFAGRMFLPARGFVTGAGRIEPIAPNRLIARLALGDARDTAEATIDLGDDRMPVRVVDGEGVIATRITAAEARAPFAPVDLIAATALPVSGAPSSRLVLEGPLALPGVPGQSSRAVAGGIALALSPRLHGSLPPGPASRDRTRDIAAIVAQLRARIAPDLGAAPTTSRTARAATAGDCTTFALAYAALAAERAIPTHIVTGFRVDRSRSEAQPAGDARLVRHRWAISWTGRAWIAVDAAFGAVPAGGDLVGIAVHDTDDIGMVAGDAALATVRAAAWQ